jgi:hypothetical protein
VRIVANLDCEVAWAGGPALPAHVRAKLGALGTLLRALAPRGEDAELVSCAPVDRARVPEVAFGPRWTEVAAEPALDAGALRWGAPPSDAIRAVADRRFALAVRERIDAALPDTRVVATLAELEAHVAALPAWIAKAPITAAGRDRVRRRGGPIDEPTRARLARLLARCGALIVEPWLERICDAGQSATVSASGEVALAAPHGLLVDDTGGFAGIAIGDPPLLPDERARLVDAARACGAALAAAGYAGPFTVDAFAWRDAAGARRFHPLCEVNPRLTFGFVARAWSERAGAPLTLRVGAGAPPAGAIALVLPAAADPTSAWLELTSP